MSLLPDGTKPLLEPMLSYCQLNPQKQILLKFEIYVKVFNHTYLKMSFEICWPYCSEPDELMLLLFSPVQGLMDMDYRQPLTAISRRIYSYPDSRRKVRVTDPLLVLPLQWRHNERDGVSIRWRLDYLFNRLFKRRPKKTSKLRVTGLC